MIMGHMPQVAERDADGPLVSHLPAWGQALLGFCENVGIFSWTGAKDERIMAKKAPGRHEAGAVVCPLASQRDGGSL